jgi:hypothetical protein
MPGYGNKITERFQKLGLFASSRKIIMLEDILRMHVYVVKRELQIAIGNDFVH